MSVPSGYKVKQVQKFTPEQMELFKQLFSNVGPDSFTSQLAQGSPEAFAQMEAPALRQFQGLQGDIASRFSGMGSGGRHGSGFQKTMNQASSDFAQDLQSQRVNMQRQALMDLMNMSNMLLGQNPYETFLQKKSTNNWGGPIGAGIGAIGGFLAGGPPGALSGASLGYNIGSGGMGSGGGGSVPSFSSSLGTSNWEDNMWNLMSKFGTTAGP